MTIPAPAKSALPPRLFRIEDFVVASNGSGGSGVCAFGIRIATDRSTGATVNVFTASSWVTGGDVDSPARGCAGVSVIHIKLPRKIPVTKIDFILECW